MAADEVHNGYFSIDKGRRSSVKRSKCSKDTSGTTAAERRYLQPHHARQGKLLSSSPLAPRSHRFALQRLRKVGMAQTSPDCTTSQPPETERWQRLAKRCSQSCAIASNQKELSGYVVPEIITQTADCHERDYERGLPRTLQKAEIERRRDSVRRGARPPGCGFHTLKKLARFCHTSD